MNDDYTVEYIWKENIGHQVYNHETGIIIVPFLREILDEITDEWYYAIGFRKWTDEPHIYPKIFRWQRHSYIITFNNKTDALKFKLLI